MEKGKERKKEKRGEERRGKDKEVNESISYRRLDDQDHDGGQGKDKQHTQRGDDEIQTDFVSGPKPPGNCVFVHIHG